MERDISCVCGYVRVNESVCVKLTLWILRKLVKKDI